MAGKYEKQNQKQSKPTNGKKTVLIVLAVILVVLVALVVAGVVYYNSMMNKINRVEVPKINYTTPSTESEETEPADVVETTEATEPHAASSDDYINFLLVGQAARDGEEERFADTMILATVNTYEKTLTLTSMLRDTQVQVKGSYVDSKGSKHTWGGTKLTMMYHNGYLWDGVAGSMAVMNQVLYDNFGVEVDYNFEIDFRAFIDAVNVLEGVDMELTEEEANYLIEDGKVWQEIHVGYNLLDGDSALAYARMRKASGDGGSDIKRTERQRKLIESVVQKLKTMNLTDVQNLVNAVLPNITTSMTSAEMTEMIVKLLPILPDLQINTGGTCPNESWGNMKDLFGDGVQHSVLNFNEKKVKAYMRELTLGETAGE